MHANVTPADTTSQVSVHYHEVFHFLREHIVTRLDCGHPETKLVIVKRAMTTGPVALKKGVARKSIRHDPRLASFWPLPSAPEDVCMRISVPLLLLSATGPVVIARFTITNLVSG